MKSFIVKPTLPVVTLHLIVIGLLAAGLYTCLHTMKICQNLQERIATVQERSRQLRQTEEKLLSYRKFLANQPQLAKTPETLKWEEVSFSWKNIPFSELLHRMDGVYANDRVFVLKSFTFSNDAGTLGISGQVQGSGEGKQANQQFELKGYYLCLCP
jgi:hypothetical protein